MEYSNIGLPDWVTGELGGYTDDTLTFGLLKDRSGSPQVADNHRYFSTVHNVAGHT